MGRLTCSESHTRKRQPQFEDKRRRHRNADSKYRSKVQYLYFKIRSLIKTKTAKDGLLDNALGHIQNLENEIYQALGSDYMESCRKEFVSFLAKEEPLWKKEKDVTKWWSNIETLLSKKQPLDFRRNESTIAIKSAVIDRNNDCDQYAKSSKRPYRKSLISSKKQKNKNDFKYMTCCCSGNECGSLFYNEGFQRDIDIETCKKKKSSLASTLWNAPDVTHFSPVVLKNDKEPCKSSLYEEVSFKDSTSLNSEKVFNAEVALAVSKIQLPLRNAMMDTLEYTKSHPSCLEKSYVEL